MWSKLLNPGGGLNYHLRALRRARTHWRPHRNQVATWLQTWINPSSQLLLIAPSGGYSLPTSWLHHFDSITAVDWDPLAKTFFLWNHRRGPEGRSLRPRLSWLRADLFTEIAGLLENYPQADILFCNFLGQAYECDPRRYDRWAAELPRLLEGRSWASFHDRFSGPLDIREVQNPHSSPTRADNDSLLRTFYSSKAGGELCEHELPPLFPTQGTYHYWGWKLTPNQQHLIEAYFSR